MPSPHPDAETAEVAPGILRVTFPLPLGIDHVHCYLLRGPDDSWTVVDTGLGVPEAEERWRSVLELVGGRVDRIVVTHFHPDHSGASVVLAAIARAPVFQGRLDHEQCVRAWGHDRDRERLAEFMRGHGLPANEAETLRADSAALAGLVDFAPDPEPLVPGGSLDGWDVLHLPGHADGHLCLLRDGVLVAGDALLASISPHVGLYPDTRPDPVGDYLGSLRRIAELDPEVAYAGHGPTIDAPAARARELVEHHLARLDETGAALDASPRTAYEVSLALFPEPLAGAGRRFALAETCAHLEHLVLDGRANRLVDDRVTRYLHS